MQKLHKTSKVLKYTILIIRKLCNKMVIIFLKKTIDFLKKLLYNKNILKQTFAQNCKKVGGEMEKKKFLNFDFLQKLGKVLMVVIAVMPAAGLMISL